MDRVDLTLCKHGRQGVPVLLGSARVRLREHDPYLRLALGNQGYPFETAVCDLLSHRHAKRIAIEPESGVGVVDEYVHRAERSSHGTKVTLERPWIASPNLL